MAVTLSRRIGADIVEVAGKGLSLDWLQMRISTREERIRTFREDVLRAAAGEMESQLGWVSSGILAADDAASPSAAQSKEKRMDVQAEIDELRANIASVRAMMIQMKQQ